MTETQAATETIVVALNKLDRDPLNVRKTYTKEGIADMAATIRGDGYRILQNLIVRKGDKRGRFFVIAGGRRVAALNLLAELGEIAKDFVVECKERNAEDATEISLIENTQREAMHPVDEYEAYRVMSDSGKSVEDIAARFGTTETMVRKRLALGREAPDTGACARFDKATRQGEDMRHAQKLLASAVASVAGKNEERAVASLFTPGGTHAIKGEFAGSNDFEVVAFMVILPESETP